VLPLRRQKVELRGILRCASRERRSREMRHFEMARRIAQEHSAAKAGDPGGQGQGADLKLAEAQKAAKCGCLAQGACVDARALQSMDLAREGDWGRAGREVASPARRGGRSVKLARRSADDTSGVDRALKKKSNKAASSFRARR